MERAQPALIGAYLAWMLIRRDSPETIRTRRYLLARTQRTMPVPLPEAEHEHLIAWMAARAGTIADSSLRAELSGLRAFYRWLVLEQHRPSDPTSRLPLPRAPRRAPKPMPEEDVALAFEHADATMAAIIALGAMGGLRACEIARLDWSEVDDGRHPSLSIVGKGGRSDVVPISRELIGYLHALPHRRGPVIRRVDDKPGPYKPHNISHRANGYLHALGITRTLHSLRHRAGTVAYRATKDPFAVKDFLRHASTQTSAGYAAAAGESIQACADAVGRIAS